MSDIPVQIRRLLPEDISSVFQIQQQLGFQTWSESQIRAEISQPCSVFLLAERDSSAVGYTLFHLLADEAELLSIAVAAAFQRQGIAQTLYDSALSILREQGSKSLFLEVRGGNLPAQRFYGKQGFTESYRRKAYYADGEEAVIMTARL